ncbi:hypothetical protein [Vibrio tritonius]|uniref:hypothetical protein n=1 Tax=Vibrio tritonius TaxID=1435069 RepID=UPI00315D96B9
MDISIIVALIGISSVIVSAVVQFVLGRLSEKSKKTNEIRSQAYLDFLNSVSDIASTSKLRHEKMDLKQLQNLTSAKTRVVLIGSDEVVQEIHNYFNKHGRLDSDESLADFSLIVSAMRRDLSGKNTLENKILMEALFGKNSNA